MKPSKGTMAVTLAMLAALAAGCSAGTDTADGTDSTQPGAVALDDVRFDVRRDPG
jgi:hypothetical protein